MAADVVTVARLEAWVRRFADLIAEHRAELTELDSAIGDADHGINMDRGMQAVRAKLDDDPARHRRRAVQAGRDDAGEQHRRCQRPPVRNLLPALRHRLRAPASPSRPTTWSRRSVPGSKARRPRQTRARRQDDVRQPAPRPRSARRRSWHRDVTRRGVHRRVAGRDHAAATTPSRWWPARVGPAISVSEAPATRIPAPRPPRCCSKPPPAHSRR